MNYRCEEIHHEPEHRPHRSDRSGAPAPGAPRRRESLEIIRLGRQARLHEKGYITDPVGKAKSVVFTEQGLRESERLLEALFGEPSQGEEL